MIAPKLQHKPPPSKVAGKELTAEFVENVFRKGRLVNETLGLAPVIFDQHGQMMVLAKQSLEEYDRLAEALEIEVNLMAQINDRTERIQEIGQIIEANETDEESQVALLEEAKRLQKESAAFMARMKD